jgi:hypothetical protein
MQSDSLTAVQRLLKASSCEVEALLPALEHLCEQTDHAGHVSKIIDRVDEMEYEKVAVLAALD